MSPRKPSPAVLQARSRARWGEAPHLIAFRSGTMLDAHARALRSSFPEGVSSDREPRYLPASVSR